MSERPTEALRYAVDQHLHDRAHNASDTDKCRASAREVLTEYDALDATIATLTAEVGRLRGLLQDALDHIEYPDHPEHKEGRAALKASIDAALTQPAPATCPECNGPADQGFSRDVPPVPYSCSKCEQEQPAPATKACPNPTRDDIEFVVDHVGMGEAAWDMVDPAQILEGAWLRLRMIDGTGRVPALEDDNAVSGEGGG